MKRIFYLLIGGLLLWATSHHVAGQTITAERTTDAKHYELKRHDDPPGSQLYDCDVWQGNVEVDNLVPGEAEIRFYIAPVLGMGAEGPFPNIFGGQFAGAIEDVVEQSYPWALWGYEDGGVFPDPVMGVEWHADDNPPTPQGYFWRCKLYIDDIEVDSTP